METRDILKNLREKNKLTQSHLNDSEKFVTEICIPVKCR